jgi:hypothetical protein
VHTLIQTTMRITESTTRIAAEPRIFPIARSLGRNLNLFLHDVVNFHPGCAVTATAPGRDADLEKALILARPDDVVCISTDTACGQIEYFARLGIGPAAENVFRIDGPRPSERGISHAAALLEAPLQLDRLCRKLPLAALCINPFIATPECLKLAAELQRRLNREVTVSGGPFSLVNTCIQKHAVLSKARELQIPVPHGEVVSLERAETDAVDPRPLREAVDRLLKIADAVIIKSAVAVLASKIYTIHATREEPGEALRQITPQLQESVYLVEVLYDVTVSPNIVFHIGDADDPIRCVGITDQRLSRQLAHHGNIFPSRATTLPGMVEAGYRLSAWLCSEGFRGIVGYDFCEYVDRANGRLAFFLTEINPRINGSVYPLFLKENLGRTVSRPIDAFISVKWFQTNVHSFDDFEDRFRHLLFTPEKAAGMVPYNTSTIGRGLVDLMIIGRTREEAAILLDAARRVEGRAGRDPAGGLRQ